MNRWQWSTTACGAVALALWSMTPGAVAQGAGPTLESDSAAQRCLVAPEGKLEYPDGLASAKLGGILRVRLTFRKPDAAPEAEVFFSTVEDPFRTQVLERVFRYRVPCLAPGETLVVAQEFEYLPGDGRKVHWSDTREEPQGNAWRCLLGSDRPPRYPRLSVDKGEQGVVLARLVFSSPDAPPKVEILFDGGRPRLADTVLDFVSEYRLPCLATADAPLRASQVFSFRVKGETQRVFRDSKLADFLGVVDGIESANVRFDFATMGCPFELRFTLLQPYLPNRVGELERRDPNRREFIEWLRKVRFKLPDRMLAQVLGDSMTIAIPCVVLNLS